MTSYRDTISNYTRSDMSLRGLIDSARRYEQNGAARRDAIRSAVNEAVRDIWADRRTRGLVPAWMDRR